MSEVRGKAFVFTLNSEYVHSYPDEVTTLADELASYLRSQANVRFACFQIEVAPSTSRRHVQGYVYFTCTSRLSAARKTFLGFHGSVPHFELARGSVDDSIAYCSKVDTGIVDTYRQIGDRPRQGSRSDLADIAHAIDEGTSMRDVASQYPSDFMRYARGIQAYQAATLAHPRSAAQEVTVLWWFGPTGTGKSRTAFERYPDSYVKMPTNKWWDGYVNQTQVIMDDYRPAMCPFSELLRILDRYPMKVEMKGSSIDLSATTFIITTCQRPEVLWNGKTEEQVNQLIRRITEIVEYNPDGTQTIWKNSSIPYVLTEVDPPMTNSQFASFVPTFRR